MRIYNDLKIEQNQIDYRCYNIQNHSNLIAKVRIFFSGCPQVRSGQLPPVSTSPPVTDILIGVKHLNWLRAGGFTLNPVPRGSGGAFGCWKLKFSCDRRNCAEDMLNLLFEKKGD
jgi:hypothetical protein